MGATSWCVPCFESSHAHTPATRTHDEDPMCQACAVRLGFEEKEPAAKAPAATAAGSAIEAPEKTTKSAEEPATARRGDPVSPRLASDPLSRKLAELFPDKKHAAQVEKPTMPKIVQIDWGKYDRLEQSGITQAAIAAELGIGKSTLDRHLAARKGVWRKQKAPSVGRESLKPIAAQPRVAVPQAPQRGATTEPSGALTVALPESALDAFFAKLPAERKIAIFTSELAR